MNAATTNDAVFYVAADSTGAILRTGTCTPDDLAIQGEIVLAFDTNPGVTDLTHRVALPGRTLEPIT